MKITHPQKACDAVLERVKYPVILMPKIDGVRGCNYDGTLLSRTLKPVANHFTRTRFTSPKFKGFDGELAAGAITSESLCRDTTSALTTLEGEPEVSWHLFDYLTEDSAGFGYEKRLGLLRTAIRNAKDAGCHIVEHAVARSLDELLECESQWLDDGYEGIIGRHANEPHKNGRATVTTGSYWRLKRFIEEDAMVLRLVEAQVNNNPAKYNALGRSERSSHKANKTGSGMLGMLVCRDLKTGADIDVSAGSMDHAMRRYYWENQTKLVGQVVKYKHFPHGRKDKPRFPTFQSIRAAFEA